MAYASRAGRAKTSPRSPRAHSICMRCGARYNRVDLHFQYDWRGTTLQSLNILVCDRCTDVPQEQLRAITLPADPTPVYFPSVQDFRLASEDIRTTQGNTTDPRTGIPVPGGDTRITQDGDRRTTQQTGEPPGGRNQEPGTDPNAPGNNDPGLPYDNVTVPKTGPL